MNDRHGSPRARVARRPGRGRARRAGRRRRAGRGRARRGPGARARGCGRRRRDRRGGHRGDQRADLERGEDLELGDRDARVASIDRELVEVGDRGEVAAELADRGGGHDGGPRLGVAILAEHDLVAGVDRKPGRTTLEREFGPRGACRAMSAGVRELRARTAGRARSRSATASASVSAPTALFKK